MNPNCLTFDATTEQVMNNEERYVATTYPVFPGIDFAFVDAHGKEIELEEKNSSSNVIEIIYCREGRSEFKLNDEFVFLSSGDLMIVKSDTISPKQNFPLNHYHGLTISIDLDRTPHCLSCFLEDVNVEPKALADRFCKNNTGFITRANKGIEHIFSEIYSVSEAIKKGYCKIKTLELLLFLSQLNPEEDEMYRRLYTKSQVLLAEKIARLLYENMDEHITLEELSDIFHVSVAHIKNTFKCVYGVPVGSYLRTLKMESVAYMLEYTDKTVLDIAIEHGYDNGSKFASAFRSVKGINPAQYRNEKYRN